MSLSRGHLPQGAAPCPIPVPQKFHLIDFAKMRILCRDVTTIYHCLLYRRSFSILCNDEPVRCIPRAEQTEGDSDMATGTVKWFNTTKGYGFIAPEDGGKDVFVHISAVERSGLTGLADDQKVTYELQEGRDGRQSAVDLALA